MPRKEKREREANFDHYGNDHDPKETANAEELAQYYSNNNTIPIDVSKFDK